MGYYQLYILSTCKGNVYTHIQRVYTDHDIRDYYQPNKILTNALSVACMSQSDLSPSYPQSEG